MSKLITPVVVPFGGHQIFGINVGDVWVNIMLRDYEHKPSWDKVQSPLPDYIQITAFTPWHLMKPHGIRHMTLTDTRTGKNTTFSWTVAKEGEEGEDHLTLHPLPGALEARWEQIPGVSTYILEWRNKDSLPDKWDGWKHGGQTRHIVDVGPEETVTFRVRGLGKPWSKEVTAKSGPWPLRRDREVDAYEYFEAGHCWWAQVKPCWYDREKLIDIEIWFDDLNDDLPAVLYERTVGLSPHSHIVEHLWSVIIPNRLNDWSNRADNGRSIAEMEINRQAAVLRNMRVRQEIERSGLGG